MNSVGAIKPMDQDEQQVQGVISDIITATLRDTVYPVDFSVYATCPRAEIDPLDMPVIYPVNYDAIAVSVSTLRRSEKEITIFKKSIFMFKNQSSSILVFR